QVIWIIVAHELVSERSDDAARYRKTGHQPYASIGLYRHRIQNLLELRTTHRMLLARERGYRRLLRQAEVFAVHEQDVIFGDVITSGIEEQSAHYIGRGRHLGIWLGINFYKVCETTAVLDAKTRGDPFGFRSDDSIGRLRATMSPCPF